MRAITRTDLGRVRGNQEDLAYAGRRLFALADGMGGAPAGDVACDLLIEALRPLDAECDADGAAALAALTAAVERGNRAVAASADADAARSGMGTTITALLLATDGDLALVHVGDSRGYRLRGGVLRQITRDDTYVQFLLDHGALDPGDARGHPQRALITQAIQGGPYTPMTGILTPQPGDRYLLCSDGLTDIVTDESIEAVLIREPDPDRCADHLIALALAAGAPDNVTIVLVDG